MWTYFILVHDNLIIMAKFSPVMFIVAISYSWHFILVWSQFYVLLILFVPIFESLCESFVTPKICYPFWTKCQECSLNFYQSLRQVLISCEHRFEHFLLNITFSNGKFFWRLSLHFFHSTSQKLLYWKQ